jgi:hypothetical protein
MAVLALLGATGTGLPSHSHRDATEGPLLVDAGHHGHGVQLLEQDEGRVAHGIGFPTPALAIGLYPGGGALAGPPAAARPVLPHSRAPPSSRPRAPPLPA